MNDTQTMRGQHRMWKYGRLFLQLLATLSVLLVVTITALAVALASSYERSTIRIIEGSHLKLLSQVTFAFDSLDTEARAFATSLSTDNRVIPLLLGRQLDIWEIVKTLDSINVLAQASSFVDSVYIYNSLTGEFYTTLGRGIRTVDTFFDAEIAALVKSGAVVERLKPLPRKIERSASDFSRTATIDVYTYVSCFPASAGSGFPSAIFVNIPVSRLLANLESLSRSQRGEGDSIFVVDSNGTVVADAHPTEFLRNRSHDAIVGKVLSSAGSSGNFIANVDGAPSVVTWISSSPAGWRFIQTAPYTSLAQPLVAQRTLIIVICVVFLLAAVLLSFLFSRMLYLPVDALVSHVKRMIDSSQSMAQSENEMRFLSEAFSQTAGMVTVLRRFKEDNMQNLRTGLVRAILDGDTREGKIRSQMQELGMRLDPDGTYYVVACQLDHASPTASASDPHDEIRTYVLERTTRALTGVRFDCETVETDRGHFAMIVCFDPGEEESARWVGALRNHVEGLQSWVKETFGISVSAAIYGPGKCLDSVAFLYHQALDLLLYRLVFGKGCFVNAADVESRDAVAFRFPIEEENRILNALKSSEADAARSAFDRFLRDVSVQQYETIQLSVTRLASSVFDLLTTMEENSTLRFPLRFSEFMHSIAASETLEEISAAFHFLFQRIGETQKGQTSQKPERNIQAIRDIVEKHFGNCTLSTTTIAGMLKMSPVYLGKLFRDHCGESISEYLTRVRMMKAQELLCCTDCTVKDLARSVGIDNPRFLYTKFKHYFGATPSQYRLKTATHEMVAPKNADAGRS